MRKVKFIGDAFRSLTEKISALLRSFLGKAYHLLNQYTV